MPNGAGFDFEPPQEKPKEDKPVRWRATYGVDERTIPSITGEGKPSTLDPTAKPDQRMAGPDANGKGDTGSNIPEGTLPGENEIFARDIDKNPSYRVGTAGDERQRILQETMDGRSPLKQSDYFMASVTGPMAVPFAYGTPVGIDHLATRGKTVEAPGFFRRTFVPKYMSTAEELIMNHEGIQKVNTDVGKMRDSVKKIIKAGGQSEGKETALNGIKKMLSPKRNGLDLAQAQTNLNNARQAGIAGKTYKHLTDDAVKVAGDDVIALLQRRRDVLDDAATYARKTGYSGTAKEAMPRMVESALLTTTAVGTMWLDDKVRSGVNTLARMGGPEIDPATGKLIPKSDVLPMGHQQTGAKNLLIPLALATHHPKKFGKTQTAGIVGLSVLGSWGLDKAASSAGVSENIPGALKRTGWQDAVGLGAGFAVPTKNWKWRMATVGTGWAVGNLAEMAMSESHRPDVKEIKDNALKELGETQSDRSYKSLNEALIEFKKIGYRSIGEEGVVENQFLVRDNQDPINNKAKWDKLSPAEKLANRRELAILSRALGEVRLTGGTKVSAERGEGSYHLKGLRADVGGYALEKLLISQTYADDAISLTRQMNGQKVGGETIDAEREVRELEKFKEDTQKLIDEITGITPKEAQERARRGEAYDSNHTKPRNMEELITHLGHEQMKGAGIDTYYNQFLLDTQWRVGKYLGKTASPEGKKFVAKLLRDEASIKMAMAVNDLKVGSGRNAVLTLQGTEQDKSATFRKPNKPNNEAKSEGQLQAEQELSKTEKGYSGAKGALYWAARLDPDNPETKELIRIYNELEAEAKKVEAGNPYHPVLHGGDQQNGQYRPRVHQYEKK